VNFSDLFIVVALGSALYGLVVAVTGQRQFLTRAVNPHRGTWLIAAASVFWVGLTLMRWEAGNWEFAAWASLLAQLVTDAPTPPRVKVASLAILFGFVLLFVVLWCVFFFPRDPSTYRRPSDRRAAFRYYVTRLRGGLDYALLASGDGEQLEEEADRRQIRIWCPHLPKVQPDDGALRVRTEEDQIKFWRLTAAQIHARMKDLDALVETAHQGRNRWLIFDGEFGGLFFRYLRLADPRDRVDTALYLFGATLNQSEMSSGRAEQHFQLLVEALKHIDRAIRVA
jgi:hypothetical protein